ncbi:MAG: hypothetical protein QXJ93_00350 [Candidatus Rehaiarchaeum fermentans]|nr:hypothetical protein [Candidatus Rehaiarchaeum fermentans]MCW1293250.1 hypothetical protein [Candidatus Rehaiarchaeum fermentans]MCW1293575.1 hypothetical protein [Candidatus Rehaiarchaeum fermentans]MCW1311282.1 hypothetical protein [Candidatus Rehaiarchaeum fermentans]
MKCAICGKEIEVLFLDKINGTYIKKEGKLYPICKSCQIRFNNNKDELLKNIK